MPDDPWAEFRPKAEKADPWSEFRKAKPPDPWSEFRAQKPADDVGRAPSAAGAAVEAPRQAPAAPTKQPWERGEKTQNIQGPPGQPALTSAQAVEEIAKRMGQGALDVLKLPGDVMTGKKSLEDPETQRSAFDLAMLAAGPGDVQGLKAPKLVEGAPKVTEPALVEAPKELRTKTADDLFRLRQSNVADRIDISKRAETVPQEARKPLVQERLFRHGEGDPSAQLTPQEKQVFDTTIQPMREERAKLYSDLKGLGYPVEPEGHMHRMVVGKTKVYDELEGGAAANPIYGSRSLPTSAASLKERKYFAIESPDGVRKVVHIDDGKMTVADSNTELKPKLHPQFDELVPGARISAGGKDWEIKQAYTSEIERDTDTRYYKNAFASEAKSLADLRAAKRNADYFEQLKTSPDFLGFARKIGGNREIPEGWNETKLPQLKGWAVEPKMARAFNDFVGPDLHKWEEGLAKVNRFAVGSLFWQPLPHVENVATHWFTGRGWDNFTPQGMKRFATTMPQAIKEVVTQGPEYQRMLKEGGGLVYGGVAQKNFYEQMMKKMGQQMEKEPSRWDPIARTFGVNPGVEFVKWWYDKANKSLWSMGDMFMMQRYLENVKKGMGAREAIREAERHIPNYRIPDEVLGSRGWSEFLQNPAFDVFSRYHYGMFKSYAEMLKDFYKGSPKEKLDAAGNVFATAVLMGVLYPAVEEGINYLLGKDEGEDQKAEKIRRGSAAIPQMVIDYYGGKKDFPELLRNSITLAPAPATAWDFYENRDPFTGQHIATTGGIPGAGQVAEHALQSTISPYKTVAQILKGAEDEGMPKSIARIIGRQLLGIRDPSERAAAAKARVERYMRREDISRQKKPKGPIEELTRKYGGPVE